MKRRRLVGRVGIASARVLRRRWSQGPIQPGWSLTYEVAVEYLRDQFHRDGPLAVARKMIDAGGDLELRRKRVQWERVSVGDLRAEWAIPPGHGDRVILYLHGGGYAFGSSRSHRTIAAELALSTGARVLSLDYRLAPEHPCPAAIEDGVAGWRWLLEQGVDPGRAWIGGDSAGGGLTLTTLLALREAGGPMPAGGVLLSPWTDLDVTGESAQVERGVDYLPGGRGLWEWAEHYAAGMDRKDPRLSPLYADLSELPPLIVFVGDAEVLLDDGLRLAERAREAGVDVELIVEPGEVHVYPMFSTLTPAAGRAYASIHGFVERTVRNDP